MHNIHSELDKNITQKKLSMNLKCWYESVLLIKTLQYHHYESNYSVLCFQLSCKGYPLE